MTKEDIYYALCCKDKRYPLWKDLYGFDGDDIPEPRINCNCDNCFYGRDRLAIEILNLQEKSFSPIKHAAIKVGQIIYIGHRHHNCFATMHDCKVSKIDAIQGFVDENGNFFDREKALEVATHFKQIKKKHNPLDRLMSEDLY